MVNTGNQPVDVTAQLTLTPSLGGSSVSLSSSTEELLPGSLANPPTPANITISFDGSGLEGDYTLSGSILVSGSTQGSVTIDSRIVSFVALRASLIPANNRNVDPGSQTTLNFILQNSGTVEDNFTVTQSNNSDPASYWVNITDQIHDSTNLLNVGAQQTHAIQIPVEVPADAANGDAVIVTVTIQSDTAGYVLSASTMVMAGGTFSAEIFQNHSHSMGENFANITPGSPRTLQYTLMNTGTASPVSDRRRSDGVGAVLDHRLACHNHRRHAAKRDQDTSRNNHHPGARDATEPVLEGLFHRASGPDGPSNPTTGRSPSGQPDDAIDRQHC